MDVFSIGTEVGTCAGVPKRCTKWPNAPRHEPVRRRDPCFRGDQVFVFFWIDMLKATDIYFTISDDIYGFCEE
jgi:hypothetical protein